MKIKHTNTPEESDRIVDLLLNGNSPLKSENTDSKERAKAIVKSLYENKPIFLTYKDKEIIENTEPIGVKISKRLEEGKEALKNFSKELEEGKQALKEFKPNKMDVQTYNLKFIPQYETASCFIQNLQHTLEGKCDEESLRQVQIIGWSEQTKKFIMDAIYSYQQKILNQLSEASNKSEKKEENNMENYIVINGKRVELTEEQLKQLGIEVEKKRNNPFNNKVEFGTEYYYIDSVSGIEKTPFDDGEIDGDFVDVANSFNDKDFANQVYLHELLNRKLLKYAWDNEAEDCEWNNVKNHYRIGKNSNNDFVVLKDIMYKTLGVVYFSTEEVAIQAIKDVVEPFMKEHPEFVW